MRVAVQYGIIANKYKYIFPMFVAYFLKNVCGFLKLTHLSVKTAENQI